MTTRQTVTLTAAAAAAASATGLLVRRLQDSAAGDPAANGHHGSDGDNRWRAVTVFLPADQVMPNGRPPAPLAELGDLVEVQVRPAPADLGTELRARLREAESSGLTGLADRVQGDAPAQRVRAALRESKQLLEVGEILRVDPAPHGKRSASLGSKMLEFTTRRAGGEGLL